MFRNRLLRFGRMALGPGPSDYNYPSVRWVIRNRRGRVIKFGEALTADSRTWPTWKRLVPSLWRRTS